MNSNVMPSNYANSDKIKYGAHYVTLLSDKVTYENNKGKFAMSYVNPNTQISNPQDSTTPKASTSNVINNDNLGTSNITSSNYIELEVPMHFFYIEKLDIVTNRKNHTCDNCGFDAMYTCDPKIVITRHEFKKGQKFAIVNAGGSVDSPVIIGVM